MGTTNLNINLHLDFEQIIEIVKQLPYEEKLKLGKYLQKEAKQKQGNDKIVTHIASENVLAKDWLSPEEDEAWKDL